MPNKEKSLTAINKSTNDRFFGNIVPLLIERLWDLNPSLFLNLVEELFMRPTPYVVREKEKRFMDLANRETLFIEETFQTVTLYEWTHEDKNKPWVIISHGWAARASQLSFIAERLFLQGHNVVSYDQTAHGESTGSATNFFDFVLVQSKVIQRYPNATKIVAHSMACSATLANIPTHPWIKDIVLISPHRDILAEIGNWFNRAGIKGRLLNSIIEHMSARYNLNFDKIRSSIAETLETRQILIIHDTNDHECAYRESQKLAREAPQSQLFTTKGLGHYRIVRAESVLEKVAEWFGDFKEC
ncbi:MAG: alpha/beta fold hydrolase [Bacteriovoracaceae bacterium]